MTIDNSGSNNPNYKHGLSKTKEHSIWREIINRCTNKNCGSYSDYGGRGIKVCDEWKNDFMRFYNDMGERPNRHTVERIDNEKGYEPSNCRWASYTDQANNRRNSHILDLGDGFGPATLAVHCRRLNINRGVVNTRVKNGWNAYDIFYKPVRFKRPRNSGIRRELKQDRS